MKNVFVLGILAILLGVFLSACPNNGPQIETVQLSSGLEAQTINVQAEALTLKAGQSNHLLYLNEKTYKLGYGRNNGGDWSFKTSWDLGASFYGASHDLFLDKNEKVHISSSISDGDDEDLGYVNNVTGFWVTSLPDAPGGSSVGMSSKIAVDHGGKVHILHHRWNDGALLYTSNIGIFWQTEKVLDDDWAQAVLVDSQNGLHVFCSTSHLTRVNSVWQTEEMPVSGYDFSAIIDGSDNIYALTDWGLWFLPANGTWQDRQDIFSQMTYEPELTNPMVGPNALAVDKQGVLHVAFWFWHNIGETGDDCWLYYATNQSGTWQATLLDHYSEAEYTYHESPVLAVSDNGEVSYAYATNNQIRFLTFNPAQL